MSETRVTPPEFAPDDPVLVAGEVLNGLDREGDYLIRINIADDDWRELYISAADVRPVPPTPDPRDQAAEALAAIRLAVSGWLDGRDGIDTMTDIRRALDEAAP